MAGRPTLYTEEFAAEICARIADGETLRDVCRDDRMPARSTVHRWVLDDVEGFSDRYARARDMQLESWAEEIQEIGDDASNDWMERKFKDGSTGIVLNTEAVMRSTLRVNNRKWLLSKLKPERYGERLNLSGSLDLNTKTDAQLDARIAQLLGKAGAGEPPGGEGTAEGSP